LIILIIANYSRSSSWWPSRISCNTRPSQLLGHGIPTNGPQSSPDPLPLLPTEQQLPQPVAFLSIPNDSPAGSFAVFFDGPDAFGIHPVNAIDAEHAVEIASALHQGARLAAVPSYALEGCNKHKVLAAWLRTAGET
jgi:hypothetical protein